MKDVRFGEGNFATDSILFPMINSLCQKAGRGGGRAEVQSRSAAD